MLKKFKEKYLPVAMGKYINFLSFISPKTGGNKAMQIFCTPRSGRLRPKDEEVLSSFTREQLEYDGLSIQCYVHGTGKRTVMLLHGWESNAARWKRLFDILLKDESLRIVAIDAPAHGLSGGKMFNSPLYARFIQTACTHYRPQALIGHSIGAASIVYALTHYEMHLPEKLVLMGSPSDFTDIAKVYADILKLSNRSEKAMLDRFREVFNMEPEYYSIGNFVKQLEVPGMVVHDTEDLVSPFSNGEKIAGNWKGAVLVPVTGSGHSLNHRETLQQVAHFVRE